jgi:PAS domain S-box-containing protein
MQRVVKRGMKREKAVAVGNRAGIVEWANAAWSRVTGYALEDAVAKPVADLLGLAGIDFELIDFVRRRFERGEPCEIELPLDPPGGERRWIHVSVESLRDRHGEVSHFAAIAWDVSDEMRADPVAPGRARPAPRAAPPRPHLDLALQSTDLSAFVRDLVARRAVAGAGRTAFDLDLPDGLPWVGLDRDRAGEVLAGLLGDAASAIGDEWGTVSVSTGLARNETVFASPTYPRNCLLRGLDHGLYAYVEVHDTGPPVDRTAVEALSDPGASDAAAAPRAGRADSLAAARTLMRAHGGDLRLDADPGFGTRVILLFPC